MPLEIIIHKLAISLSRFLNFEEGLTRLRCMEPGRNSGLVGIIVLGRRNHSSLPVVNCEVQGPIDVRTRNVDHALLIIRVWQVPNNGALVKQSSFGPQFNHVSNMFHLLDFFSLPIIQSNDYLSYDNKLLFLVICDCASMDKICNLSLYRKKNFSFDFLL